MKVCRKKSHKYDATLKQCPFCQKDNKIKNAESIKHARKIWRKANRAKERAYEIKHLKANPGKKAKNKREWDRLKRETDPKHRISTNLRNRLNIAIKRGYKSGSAIRDLGCSIEELKKHLESLFLPFMGWENYGKGIDKWSIDHIIPLSKVDLSDRKIFTIVNHYTNLRPLWNKDQLVMYHSEQKKVVI